MVSNPSRSFPVLAFLVSLAPSSVSTVHLAARMDDRWMTRSGSLEIGPCPLCVSVPCTGPLPWLMCNTWLQNCRWLFSVVSHLRIPMAPVLYETRHERSDCVSFSSLAWGLDHTCCNTSSLGSLAFPLNCLASGPLFLASGFLALGPCTVSSGVVILPAFIRHAGSHEGRMVCSLYQASREMSATCNTLGNGAWLR